MNSSKLKETLKHNIKAVESATVEFETNFGNEEVGKKYGSGIRRIINYFIEAGLPKPTFQKQSSGFLVTVYGKEVGNVVENVVENEKKILELIRGNAKYSAQQMSELLGLTQRTVQRYLKELQNKNIIERIGPAKGGHWQIIQSDG